MSQFKVNFLPKSHLLCVHLVVPYKLCGKSHCFLGKFTQLTLIFHRCTWGGTGSAALAEHLQPPLHDRLHLLPDHLQTCQEEVEIFFLPFFSIPHPLLGEVTVYWLATTTPEWRARQTASCLFLACVSFPCGTHFNRVKVLKDNALFLLTW